MKLYYLCVNAARLRNECMCVNSTRLADRQIVLSAKRDQCLLYGTGIGVGIKIAPITEVNVLVLRSHCPDDWRHVHFYINRTLFRVLILLSARPAADCTVPQTCRIGCNVPAISFLKTQSIPLKKCMIVVKRFIHVRS